MQAVHLVEGEHVDDALHLGLVEEVARDVEHVAAVAQEGLVVDGKPGHCPIGRGGGGAGEEGRGEQLAERLQAVEETGVAGSTDFNALGSDGELVGFRRQRAVGEQTHRSGFGRRARGFRRHGGAGGLAQAGGEVGGQFLEAVGREGHGVERFGVERRALFEFEILRIGDEGGEFAITVERALAFKGEDVVHIVVGHPKAHFLPHTGAAPLVERDVVVAGGVDFEMAAVFLRHGHHKRGVALGFLRSDHHAALRLRSDVELLAELVGDGAAGG